MPLIEHNNLPSFSRLRLEGQEVLHQERAHAQDIRELHIGFLNMMPDAALQSTERQFLRLIGASNRIAQFYVHLFTFDEIHRGYEARKHIDQHYESLAELQRDGLDALILSGANPEFHDITKEPYWNSLVDLIEWARFNVCSTWCSCFSTHAVAKHLWNIERRRLPKKKWGIYSHRVVDRKHPLTSNINTRFDAPHSRFYDVDANSIREAGLKILVESVSSGAYLATSDDGFRFVFFQGHPEYDAVSLIKEYRREIERSYKNKTASPVFPENYFPQGSLEWLNRYSSQLVSEGEFNLENKLLSMVDNTWTDTAKALANNWLGLIYQVAHVDRKKVFMPDVDSNDPLGIKSRESKNH